MSWTTQPEALQGSLGQRISATAHAANGDLLTALEVTDAVVTFDSEWAPHVQATVSCRLVAAEVLNLLDPRRGVRVRISAGYFSPSDTTPEDMAPLVDLGLRARPVRRPDNTMALELASDEALVQDWRAFPADASTIAAGTHVGVAIRTLILKALPSASVVAVTIDPTLTTDTITTVASSTDVWAEAAALASYRAYVVFDDGLRQWSVMPRPMVPGTPVHRLATGENLVTTDSTLARAASGSVAWGNAVIAEWEKSGTTNPAENRGYAEQTTGPYAVSAVGRRVVTVKMAGTASTVFATRNARAATILPRVLARGRELTLSAVNALWVRPFSPVEAQLPTWGTARVMMVTRVAFRWPSGRMDVAVRMPDDSAVGDGE